RRGRAGTSSGVVASSGVGMAAASPASLVFMSAILDSMTDDPAMEPAAERRPAALRRRQMITAGHSGQADRARRGLDDPDPDVQAAALGALARPGTLSVSDPARAPPP